MLGGFLMGLRSRSAIEHAHDVALLHDQEFDAIELDLGTGPLSEQHPVTDLKIDRDELARFIAAAGTDSRDLAGLRFLFCSVGDDDAAGSLGFGIDALNDHAVV